MRYQGLLSCGCSREAAGRFGNWNRLVSFFSSNDEEDGTMKGLVLFFLISSIRDTHRPVRYQGLLRSARDLESAGT